MVFIEKGGEIIPKITMVDYSQRKADLKPVTYITHCPECGTALVRNEGEANHYCPNEDHCAPQVVGKIEHFVARKAMDIDSMGTEAIELLYKYNLVKNVADLYDLTESSFDNIKLAEGWKTERSGFVSNILNGIQASKAVPFERLLFGLGIRYVGETVAKKLAAAFKNIDSLQQAGREELIAVDEIGDRIAESIIQWFEKPEHQKLIERLRHAGLRMESDNTSEPISEKLKGLTFVISGVFSKFSRDEARDLIERNGGKNAGSVSSKTNYLLAGEGMGPAKLEKATSLGVKIIDENELLAMLDADSLLEDKPQDSPTQSSLF
jgi:DNA ligase (NAD+)